MKTGVETETGTDMKAPARPDSTRWKTWLLRIALVCALAFALPLLGCSDTDQETDGNGPAYTAAPAAPSDASSESSSTDSTASAAGSKSKAIDKNGSYTSKSDVALYIHTYGHLPENFISKTKARKAGWDSSKGNLGKVCPGKSIGGGTFNNDDGLLPEKPGRTWKECDINYHGGARGAERIVFSNDGLIYYTSDHYKSFQQLY